MQSVDSMFENISSDRNKSLNKDLTIKCTSYQLFLCLSVMFICKTFLMTSVFKTQVDNLVLEIEDVKDIYR